jgi:hypothetical protein
MSVDIVKEVTEVVSVASLVHTMLPPWDALGDFPRAQKYYKLFVYLVGYVALNGRSTVYSSLSTKDGTQSSKAVNGAAASAAAKTQGDGK